MSNTSSSSKGKIGCFIGLIIPVLIAATIWFFFLGPKLHRDRLLEKGIQAPGRLLDVEETGTVINDSPELELLVEFRRNDGVLDTATTDFVPSLRSIHLFQPGAIVTAAYDPEDPEDVTIVSFGAATAVEPSAGEVPGREMNRVVDSLRQAADSLQRFVDSLQRRGEK